MVIMGYLASAMERRRVTEREAAALVASHGDDAERIASHLATHPALGVATRRPWKELARVIGCRRKRQWDLRAAATRR